MEEDKLTNWAGNYVYSTNKLIPATSLDQIRNFVYNNKQFKVLGSRHCFNGIADTKHIFLSMKTMDDLVSINEDNKTVTVSAGATYGKVAPILHQQGYALHNLASLPHISVAGACITATHGSGVKNGNLATAVLGMEVVTANGDVKEISKENDPELFYGSVVNLGGIGVLTKMTLSIQPTFNMRQVLFENLQLSTLESNLNEILSSGYSVSLFTDWKSNRFNQVWIKSRADQSNEWTNSKEFFGANPATKNLHPIGELSAIHCTEQMGVEGEWYERLPHFKMGFTPSSGKELQSEYFVPYEHAYKALNAVSELKGQIAPLLQISEIRTIAEDNFWMSPCYKTPSMAIHFTWKQDWPAVQKILPLIEEKLQAFRVRPHWGKLFTMAPGKLKSSYERLNDFKELLYQMDPEGKFKNEFLQRNIYGV